MCRGLSASAAPYVYDDVTYVYDDVTYVYDDVTYVQGTLGKSSAICV
jgi:hypothetical protein